MSSLNESSDTAEVGGAGVTSYNLVDGEFFLRQLPIPDSQVVKKTVQGIADTFSYQTDELEVNSMIQENDAVKVTETVFNGELLDFRNKSTTSRATDGSSQPFNRIVFEGGIGQYSTLSSANFNSSSHNEIIAIAVEDVRPFLLKSLDYEHRADLKDNKPTNSHYIRHLTPEKNARIATITAPSIISSNGGPSKILVHYEAIDLTGEVVAGTSIGSGNVNTAFSPYYASGDKGYLIVKEMFPPASTVLSVSGTPKTIAELLLKPYSSVPSNHDDILLDITAAGGIVSVPATNFNRPLKSHTMTSAPFGDVSPSVFVNVDDCVVMAQTSKNGYGRPKAIPSLMTPDEDANSDFHTLSVVSVGGNDRTDHSSSKATPSAFSRSNLTVFDIIDNEVENNENLLLIQPSNRMKHEALSDLVTATDNPSDPCLVSIELTMMKARVEEISPETDSMGAPVATIRGRSQLMDITDQRSDTDFNLSEGTPVKEIGDMGSPTVSISLGGAGQGMADAKTDYEQHSFLDGWKDRLVTTGNPSVRNDKATSTLYASTRALVEIPIFPSSMFDVQEILSTTTEKGDPLPANKSLELMIDCTMTAMNRPHMSQYENRYSIDWGMYEPAAAFKVNALTDAGTSIRCQRLSEQCVCTAASSTAGSTITLTVDDTTGFAVNEYVSFGEGFLNTYGYYGKISALTATSLDIVLTKYAFDNSTPSPLPTLLEGMPVIKGGFVFPDSTTYTTNATLAGDIASQIRTLFNWTSSTEKVFVDYNDDTKFYIHPDGTNMNGFVFDPFELEEANNDRNTILPVDCFPAALSLKGKKSDDTLDYVQPMTINLGEIASVEKDFASVVEEVIRRINMAGHPDAKNSTGGSAFDPPPLFTASPSSANTGSHMGYVRAFVGSSVESRTGENGVSIVIHSTVPGASGRNFAVWLTNNSPYAYKPKQAVGFGGLLATNSRHYKANSFPAPLPLGLDGETFVPITTFTGAPHGATHLNDTLRSYDGLGGSFTVVTTIPSLDIGGTGTIVHPVPASFNAASDPPIDRISVDISAQEVLLRGARKVSYTTNKGILRINGRLATFEAINSFVGINSSLNTFQIQNIRPYKETQQFYEDLFATDGTTELEGVSVEIFEPIVDSKGILFFGGGHTGVTFDVSDGTNKDYSDFYKHHYSKGPTGFSGFQNLGDVSTASAVLDFTDLKNNDTINDNTLRGFHHKMELDSNGEPTDLALTYIRTNVATSGAVTEDATKIEDELYGKAVYLTTAGARALANGPAYASGKDEESKAIQFTVGDAVTLAEENSGVQYDHPVSNNFTGENSWTISAWIKNPTDTHVSGPILHGIAKNSPNKPYGLSIGGCGAGTNFGQLFVAVTRPTAAPLNVRAGVLFGQATTLGIVKYQTRQWMHIVAGYDADNSRFFCYFGSEGNIYIDGGSPTVTNGIVDLTDYMADVQDHNYAGSAPNTDALGFRTGADGLSASTADHPDIHSSLGSQRERGMVAIGMALFGAPYVVLDPTKAPVPGAPATTNGGTVISALDAGTTLEGYFNEEGASATAKQYGDVGSGATGTNNAGPIYMDDTYMTDVAIFRRALTFAEAQTLFNGKSVW